MTIRKVKEKLITAQEVAALFRVGIAMIYTLTRSHRLRGVKVGGQWQFTERAIEEFIDRHRTGRIKKKTPR